MSSVTGEIGYKVDSAATQRIEVAPVSLGATIIGTATINNISSPSAVPALTILGGTGIGHSSGLLIIAGENSGDNPLKVVQPANAGGGTTFLLAGDGSNFEIGIASGVVPYLSGNSAGNLVANSASLQVKSLSGATTYLTMSSSQGLTVENINATAMFSVMNQAGVTQTFMVNGQTQATLLGTSTAYAWGTGTSYPILQLAGVGAVFGTATTGIVLTGGGLYYNGTKYIYGQAGTGIIATLGTGTFSISCVDTSGTAAGTATPTVVMSISGSAGGTGVGGVVIGTSTLYAWGTGSSFTPVIQLGGVGGIFPQGGTLAGPTVTITAGCWSGNTAYQFTGTGTGNTGTSTAAVLILGQNGMFLYSGGVGTYGQAMSGPTDIFVVAGTVAPVIRGYGPNAATLVDMTPDSGTFTGTWGGFVAGPTNTACYWCKSGNQVTIMLPWGTGSSNATTKTFAPLPAEIQPAQTQWCCLPLIQNNSSFVAGGGVVQISAGSGTLNFMQGAGAAAFTASGGCTIGGGAPAQYQAFTYALGP